ncbi:unannotated protein [freshwater metagenome]|uniref:Unannotated protein n=1 Tax=freshwater metagenome TaxID=449393 RepID=A0A6J6EJZ5_9ZZZZ
MLHQPVVDLALLTVGGMQLVPRVGTTTRGSQTRDAQLRAVRIGEGLELVQLRNVMAGDDHRDLEGSEVRRGEVVHGASCHVVGPDASHRVVGDGVHAVEADLDVQVIHGRESAGLLGVDEGTVRAELHADAVTHRVLEQLEEVSADHGLATTDVDVEDLQVAQFVEHALGLGGGQLALVALAAGRQTVHALQVAGVGEFPRETDRGVEAPLHLINQR